MVMTEDTGNGNGHERRALIELTPELRDRLRDPRLVLGWALCVAGAVALLIGYWGVSGTLDPGKQLPYIISGGIGGVFALGAGAALIFAADLGDARRQIGELKDLLETVATDVAEVKEQTAAATANGQATTPARTRSKRGT
jgi:hypothetical protein